MSHRLSPLPCLVCGRTLEAIDASPDAEHPQDGVAFTTQGNYGSTVFDEHDRRLHVNVCDPCLTDAIAQGRTRETALPPPPTPLDPEARRLLDEAEVIESWEDPKHQTRTE
jgi:hypothetical protein